MEEAIQQNFLTAYHERYNKAWRKVKRFKLENKEWLQTSISLNDYGLVPNNTTHDPTFSPPEKKLRKMMTSPDFSFRKKRSRATEYRKLEAIREAIPQELLIKALTKESVNEIKGSKKLKTLEESVAAYMDLRASVRRYEVCRDSFGHVRSYYEIKNGMKESYPKNIIVDDDKATVRIEDMMIHTLNRIVKFLRPSKKMMLKTSKNLEFVVKIGFDSTSGLSNHKTRTTAPSTSTPRGNFGDSSAFVAAMSPLIIRGDKGIIWKNPLPSSNRFCRPFEIILQKEEDDFSKRKYDDYKAQIDQLGELEVDGRLFQPLVVCSMLDGKSANAVTGQKSSRCCNICFAGPKHINDPPSEKFKARTENYVFGLPPLHTKINTMTNLFHVACNLDFKKGEAHTKEEKEFQSKRKILLQDEFKSRMGVFIDFVRPGSGNSSDGNTARIFFSKVETVCEITSLHKEVVSCLATLLHMISSLDFIPGTRFRDQCQSFKELYNQHYSWYPMTPTLHKLVEHGPAIAEHLFNNFGLSIGQCSEEALESGNKCLKYFRKFGVRFTSRKETMLDLFRKMMVDTDPGISIHRRSVRKLMDEEYGMHTFISKHEIILKYPFSESFSDEVECCDSDNFSDPGSDSSEIGDSD